MDNIALYGYIKLPWCFATKHDKFPHKEQHEQRKMHERDS